jgi:hypothetical protein
MFQEKQKDIPGCTDWQMSKITFAAKSLDAIIALWPEGEPCILPEMQNLQVGLHANTAFWPEGKNYLLA